MKKTGPFLLKRDNFRLGLVLGLLTPFLVLIIIYFIKFGAFSFGEFLSYLRREKSLMSFWGVWCLVGNIALFTLYINTNRDKTAKGIFAVTVAYGLAFLILKTTG